MFKKLALLSVLSLLTFSCKKEIQSKPKFEKPEFKTSEETFIKQVNIGDSISFFMTYKGKKGLFKHSSVNKLSMAIFLPESEELNDNNIESFFNKINTKARSEILNFNNYDVFQVLFYKGKTKFSEKESIINLGS